MSAETRVVERETLRLSGVLRARSGTIITPLRPQTKRPGSAAKRSPGPTTPRLRTCDRMDILTPEPTSVYRYYDQNRLLLYVGITSRATKRQREHNGDKDWWPFVASQEVEHYPTRTLAATRERQLIVEFRPPFNTQHNIDHENLRALYLAARDSLPANGAAREHVAAMDPREAFQAVRGKVPLAQVETGNIATFAVPGEFRHLLTSAANWSSDVVLLRTPRKCGVLTEVRLFEARPRLTFTGQRGGIPALRDVHLHMKVVRTNPFVVRMHEAVGEKLAA